MSKNVVYVGINSVMNYVYAIMTSFSDYPEEEVVLRARERAISVAMDAVEVTRKMFITDLKHNVSIGTEELKLEEGGTRNVSTIKIVLSRSPEAIEHRGREQTTQAG